MNDDQIIDGIIKRNPKAIEFLYKKVFPIAKRIIIKNGGTLADAEDLFNDALIVLYQRLRQENFSINVSIQAYILGTVKFKWFRLVKRSNLFTTSDFDEGTEDSIEHLIIENEKRKLFQKCLETMAEDCKRVLTYFFEGRKMMEIAELMGFKSERIAKKKKYLCKERLVEKIKNSAEYQELL